MELKLAVRGRRPGTGPGTTALGVLRRWGRSLRDGCCRRRAGSGPRAWVMVCAGAAWDMCPGEHRSLCVTVWGKGVALPCEEAESNAFVSSSLPGGLCLV